MFRPSSLVLSQGRILGTESLNLTTRDTEGETDSEGK